MANARPRPSILVPGASIQQTDLHTNALSPSDRDTTSLSPTASANGSKDSVEDVVEDVTGTSSPESGLNHGAEGTLSKYRS